MLGPQSVIYHLKEISVNVQARAIVLTQQNQGVAAELV